MHIRSCIAASTLLLAILGCREDTTAPTESAPTSRATAVAATALVFRQVSAGGFHTCGVTEGNIAYCWGVNSGGELGIGTTVGPETCQPFNQPCSTRPVAVAGNHHFGYVSAGEYHTCGVTTENVAYCWGRGGTGELGTGSEGYISTVPVAVATTLRFRQVEAGSNQTCGLSVQGHRAYCWGSNNYGQLGNGSNTGPELCSVYRVPCSTRPVAVAGRRVFREVTAGRLHSCAVTPSKRAYCWGDNRSGEIGDSTAVLRLQPSLVAGGHRFVQIDAGGGQTCAVTASDRAFCWGYGGNGEIGDGQTGLRFWPSPVAGGLSIESVSAGVAHACAESIGNVAYCWGANLYGQLGDGTALYRRLTPVAVAGGFLFVQVSASQGGGHSCGMTSAGVVYCWGSNNLGQVGDGARINRLQPTPVAGVP